MVSRAELEDRLVRIDRYVRGQGAGAGAGGDDEESRGEAAGGGELDRVRIEEAGFAGDHVDPRRVMLGGASASS
jgi:hypothetical protein